MAKRYIHAVRPRVLTIIRKVDARIDEGEEAPDIATGDSLTLAEERRQARALSGLLVSGQPASLESFAHALGPTLAHHTDQFVK